MTSHRFDSGARAAGVVVLGVGAIVLLGWLSGVAALTSVLPGLVRMKVNTAVAFLLTGTSLLIQISPRCSARIAWAARACALGAMAIGAVTLAEYTLGVDLGIDQLAMPVPADEPSTFSPGRMAPNTALGFALAGAVLAVLDARARVVRRAAQAMTIAVLLIGFVACTGYLFGVAALYGIAGYTAMAIHTAAGLLALSIGILLARPQRGVIAILAQDNAAGAALRRTLPVIVILPLAVGWLRLKGQHAGFYGTEFGLALMVTVTTGLIVSLALWNARVQGVSEMARDLAVRDDHFLLELGELLRTASGSAEALFLVSKKLGQHLGASRCLFMEIDLAGERATVRRDYHDGFPSLAATRSLSSYSATSVAAARAGRTVVNHDASTDDRTSAQYDSGYRPAGIRAYVAIPLLRNGHWVSTLLVSTHEPRIWQTREVTLTQSVAERTWLWFEHLESLDALRQSQQRAMDQLRLTIEAAASGMIMVNQRGEIVLVNAQVEQLFGYPRADLIGQPVEILLPERQRHQHAQLRTGFLQRPQFRAMGAGRDLYGLHRDGSEIPIEIGLSPLAAEGGDFVLSTVVDITERKRGEQERERLLTKLATLNSELEDRVRGRTAQLSSMLKEREVLLQEVHHRVKNNLQVISSLINMQIRKLQPGTDRAGLEECKTRVEAIALIHEKLYQSKDYARVPFSDYAASLARHIFYATGVSSANIRLAVDMENIALPVDQAIPCGLILNELITNALKHAFPGDRDGAVRVELRKTSPCDMLLAVSDDGVGLERELDPGTSSTLGMQLVTTLVEQLDGQLRVVRGNGTSFQISFPFEDGTAPLASEEPSSQQIAR